MGSAFTPSPTWRRRDLMVAMDALKKAITTMDNTAWLELADYDAE